MIDRIYQSRMPFAGSMRAERFELIDVPGLPRCALLRTGARLLFQDYPDEYRAFPPDIELLDALARASGGKLAPSVAEVFAQQGDESRTTKALWPCFAVLALIFYLLDIAARRSPLAWRWLES